MPITIDRDKARRYGLSTQQIGYALRSALFGREVSRYKDGEDDYPINLRFADTYRNNADALMNQKIIFRSQSDGKIKEVPISAVASAGRSTTYNAIKRKDLDRTVALASNVLARISREFIRLSAFEIISGSRGRVRLGARLPSIASADRSGRSITW